MSEKMSEKDTRWICKSVGEVCSASVDEPCVLVIPGRAEPDICPFLNERKVNWQPEEGWDELNKRRNVR